MECRTCKHWGKSKSGAWVGYKWRDDFAECGATNEDSVSATATIAVAGPADSGILLTAPNHFCAMYEAA